MLNDKVIWPILENSPWQSWFWATSGSCYMVTPPSFEAFCCHPNIRFPACAARYFVNDELVSHGAMLFSRLAFLNDITDIQRPKLQVLRPLRRGLAGYGQSFE